MKRKLFIFGMIASMLLLAFICIPVFAAEGETVTENVTPATQAAEFIEKWLAAIIVAGSGFGGSAFGLALCWYKIKKIKKKVDDTTEEGKQELDKAKQEYEDAKKNFEVERENFKEVSMGFCENAKAMISTLEKSENKSKEMMFMLCEEAGKVPQFVADGTAARMEECLKGTIETMNNSIEELKKLQDDIPEVQENTEEEGV